MKYNTRIRLGTVSKTILGIVAVAGLVSIAVVAPNALQILIPRRRYKVKPRIQGVNKSIEALIASGLLQDKGGSLKLTKKGRWEVGIRSEIISPGSTRKWDGKWRIVIFDVPENKRGIRRELRRAIALYGFVKLQQSAWVYPYKCDDFVHLVRTYLGIKQNIICITADTIENDSWLKKEFGL